MEGGERYGSAIGAIEAQIWQGERGLADRKRGDIALGEPIKLLKASVGRPTACSFRGQGVSFLAAQAAAV